jgi:Holliday junction resolvasome RuvABC endonuclease subunit
MDNGNGSTVCLALDVSTKTGYAILKQDKATQEIILIDHGCKQLVKKIAEYGEYPWSYLYASRDLVVQLTELVARINPDVVVVEETNKGQNRYSQKILEFLHNTLLVSLDKYRQGALTPPVFYLSTSEWRKVLDQRLSKQDKINNKLVKTAADNKVKKPAGIKGKIGKKHLSVRWVNETYGLDLKMKDNDSADAISLGTAFLRGARACDGK